MFCTRCGGQIGHNCSNCTYCGSQVSPGSSNNQGFAATYGGWGGAHNPQQADNGKGVASMVLGILCLVFCAYGAGLFLGIPAIILGNAQQRKQKNGMATAGIVMGIIGLILSIFFIIIFAIYLIIFIVWLLTTMY